ncbi:hypothetical protein DSO57_1014428 [Entomophthora muscae]|uniref:Uncharacterized protein n=2 Tax=Entomophthora muscae TaxID=34485 RepID=A0ACC2UR43_9FUNG|nr:hypothetical protein DSO57_1014428 [Entomophthora muscae]
MGDEIGGSKESPELHGLPAKAKDSHEETSKDEPPLKESGEESQALDSGVSISRAESETDFKDSLAETQDTFSITSASPELNPIDGLDEEFTRLYESTSASELASATVAAMIDEMDDDEDLVEQPEDFPNASATEKQTVSKEVLSPRLVGTHPLSREITSPSHQHKKVVPIPMIKISSEPRNNASVRKPPSRQPRPEVAPLKANSRHEDEKEPSPSTPGFMTKNLGAHDWTTTQIQTDFTTGHFRDNHGRFLLLRGANVAACSKLPNESLEEDANYPNPGFYDHRKVDFVGRPFPLEEAAEHFRRLRLWGLSVLRFLIPWEALEHEGPGVYDHRYIEYLRQLFEMAHDFGMKVVIDPHQDVWSRFSGGSGAPGWTFDVAGMDLTQLDETGAAHIQGMPLVHPSHSPLWSTNYTKLATATMFTIFFGGNTFAPGRSYDGIPVQEFLQKHYCDCYRHLASQLKGLAAVLGFGTMNEPHAGYIGLQRLDRFDVSRELHLGLMPSPLQSMALGDGIMQRVPYYNKSWPWPFRSAGTYDVNKNGARAWLSFTNCIWREQGVWDIHSTTGAPVALKPDYFSKSLEGRRIDFGKDFYLPFIKRFTTAIREANPELTVFFAPIPNCPPPKLQPNELGSFAYAPNWYDMRANYTKSFDGRVTYDVISLRRGSRNLFAHTYFGTGGARRCYAKQVKTILDWGKEALGTPPSWIGEIGIPFDINNRVAFESRDYALHELFMDAVLNAVDENFASCAVWNYNPLNSHEGGDHWNEEDFSFYSKDHVITPDRTKEVDNPLHKGGRCLGAIARPYAAKVAGQPLHTSFDLATMEFHLEFASAPPPPATGKVSSDDIRMWRQTEIYLPSFHYKRQKLLVDLSDGAWRYVPELQTLYYWFGDDRKVEPVAPITDYEDDGMESSDEDFDSSQLRASSGSNTRADFEVRQLQDGDEPEYDPSLIPPNGMVHKIRIMVQDHLPEQEW